MKKKTFESTASDKTLATAVTTSTTVNQRISSKRVISVNVSKFRQ